MPRQWTDEDRGWNEREARRDGRPREDFGQADYSQDYVYDEERRTAYRAADEDARRRDGYRRSDYSDEAYDPERRDGPDRDYGRRMDAGRYRSGLDRDPPRDGEGRSWRDRAGAFLGGRERESDDERDAHRRRRGPSDRVLWAVIAERLESIRGLDLRDVEVLVDDGEVTLNGVVRRKEDKRRIEDLVDVDGVRNVQNNLRPRERRWF